MTGNISFSKGMLRVCREALVEREAPSTRQVIAAVVCGVCKENDSQYTCPRCNCRYCSLGCFQKHGARCTESFYKEQVVDELKSRPVTSENERREMLAILKRMQEEVESNEECKIEQKEDDATNGEFLGTALENLELTEDVEWDDLTPEQQHAFRKAAAEGKLSPFVEVWEPWWLYSSLVLPVECEKPEGNMQSQVPPIASPIPALSTLTSKAPSDLLKYSVVDILWSYAYCQRWCNGEACRDPSLFLDAAESLVAHSAALSHDPPSQSVGTAISDCQERCTRGGASVDAAQLIRDAAALVGSKFAALAGLSDAREILLAAHKELQSGKHKGKKGLAACVSKAEKKLWFILCWTQEQPPELFSRLSSETGALAKEEEDHAELAREAQRPKQGNADQFPEVIGSGKSSRQGKSLVQEL